MGKNWLLDSVKMTDTERLLLLSSVDDITAEVDKKITAGMKPSDAIIEVVKNRLGFLRRDKNGK